MSWWAWLFGILAAGWAAATVRAVLGMRTLPVLGDIDPLCDTECPSVAILFAARDEAAELPRALPTLLAEDYPRFSVVATDDRSVDGTSRILDEFAARDTRLKVVHLTGLPDGWLGKPHALDTAYRNSDAEWLVLTDADVRFAPTLLSRAVALARKKEWDHLTVLPPLDMESFWERSIITYWLLGCFLNWQPWRVADPRSRSYAGVGAFQIIKRSAYEAIGTHRRLAMEVVDDLKLGKLVKQAGLRSGVAAGHDMIFLRWVEGLRGVVNGIAKNGFAALQFSLLYLAAASGMLVISSVVPFAALFFAHGTTRVAAAICVAAILAAHAWAARWSRVSVLYALAHPLAAIITLYTLLRSAALTLGRGGILWRGTFYPLKELRKGLV